jgi:hypothetical protein
LKRKPILQKWLSARAGYEGKRTIGLIGINRGVGVTYTGMLMAHFFGNENKIRTAYLECNNHMDFARLQEAYEWSHEDESSFSLDRVTYYKQVRKSLIPEILNYDHDCYILDFGTDFNDSMEEFIRCEYKIIIGDSAIWNQNRMISFLRSIENMKGVKQWIHMIPFADKRTIGGMRKEADRFFIGIPFEPNPTLLSKETHKIFSHMFKSNQIRSHTVYHG